MNLRIDYINNISYRSIAGVKAVAPVSNEPTKEVQQANNAQISQGNLQNVQNQNVNVNGIEILAGQNQALLQILSRNNNPIGEKTLSLVQEKFDNANITSFDTAKNSQVQQIVMESVKESGLVKNIAANNRTSIGQVNVAIDKFLTNKLDDSQSQLFTPTQVAIINDFNSIFVNESFAQEPTATLLNQYLQ